MGTPDFSAIVLRKLCESGNTPIAVVTRVDKPAGRGNELRPSPVKKYAIEQEIEVLQTEKLSDEIFMNRLTELAPDLIIVVAYGRTEADSSVLKSDCERKVHLQRLSAVNEVLVCDSDYIAVL